MKRNPRYMSDLQRDGHIQLTPYVGILDRLEVKDFIFIPYGDHQQMKP
jgi:hypothetical protein